MCFILDRNILVYSFGGVASKLLLAGVSLGKSTAEIEHCHRHDRVPPKIINDEDKVVYLFGNPLNSVISFFNRRYYLHSGHGSGYQSIRESRKDWAYKHCNKIQGDCSDFSIDWNLEDYLSNGKDLFNLEEHFDNWVNAKVDYPILLIKYETIWEHLPDIFLYLELPDSQIENFPRKQKRISDWREQSDHIKKSLLMIYGSLFDKINNFDEIKTI